MTKRNDLKVNAAKLSTFSKVLFFFFWLVLFQLVACDSSSEKKVDNPEALTSSMDTIPTNRPTLKRIKIKPCNKKDSDCFSNSTHEMKLCISELTDCTTPRVLTITLGDKENLTPDLPNPASSTFTITDYSASNNYINGTLEFVSSIGNRGSTPLKLYNKPTAFELKCNGVVKNVDVHTDAHAYYEEITSTCPN